MNTVVVFQIFQKTKKLETRIKKIMRTEMEEEVLNWNIRKRYFALSPFVG